MATLEGDGDAKIKYIRPSLEQTGCIALMIELIKTIIDVNIIILSSIFRFFVPAKKKDLSGEIAVITGAAGYIGRLLALRFAAKGNLNKSLHYIQSMYKSCLNLRV